jgi:hypothetical protein
LIQVQHALGGGRLSQRVYLLHESVQLALKFTDQPNHVIGEVAEFNAVNYIPFRHIEDWESSALGFLARKNKCVDSWQPRISDSENQEEVVSPRTVPASKGSPAGCSVDPRGCQDSCGSTGFPGRRAAKQTHHVVPINSVALSNQLRSPADAAVGENRSQFSFEQHSSL